MTFVIYAAQPAFPATDQSPNCVRYQVGNLWVDTDNAQPPTQADIDVIYAPGITAQQRAKDFLADKDLGDFRALIASATSPADLKTKIAALTAPAKANLIVAFILDYVASGRG